MINRALADAGGPERFVALATGDQTASFILADPERLAPLAKRFHLPLSDDPDEAMRKGLEYERQVIESLKR